MRTRPHDEIEPIEVEGFYQKPRCFPFPSHGVQDATPPGREWFLELIVEHLPSHRGPAMIGDTERLIPNLYREAAEELRQWARRARLTDIRSDLLELSARYERLANLDKYFDGITEMAEVVGVDLPCLSIGVIPNRGLAAGCVSNRRRWSWLC